MTQSKTYSFIIPHYNTPQLLHRLIDSIPIREDIEILVIDDNSDFDKKPEDLRKDTKIIFLDGNNSKGAGKARNIGIEQSSGKWLLFADADDFYCSCFIDILDEYRDLDIDFLFFNVKSCDSETLRPAKRAMAQNVLINNYDGSFEKGQNLLYLSYAPWMRMFNASFVKRHGIRYEEIPRTNDVFFSLQSSYFSKKFSVDKRCVYTVTYNAGSLTANNTPKEKYQAIVMTTIRMVHFYKYIGFRGWEMDYTRDFFHPNIYSRFYAFYNESPKLFMKALLYYISHWIEIKKKSNYYVDIIKQIERNISSK